MISVKHVNNIVDAFPVGILAQTEVLTPEENDLLMSKVLKYINYVIHLVQEIHLIG
jgi:hypothetical protein